MSPDLHSVQVRIGGTAIRFLTEDPVFKAMLVSRYGPFVDPSAKTVLQLSVRLLPPSVTPEDAGVQVAVRNGRWSISRGDFRCVWDPLSGAGLVEQTANPHSIDTVIRIVHTLILARSGGFLLHASSAVRDGRAFLFSGLSGAGKTTLVRLAPPDVRVLTDEISYVRPAPGYTAFGTPFFGELGIVGENVSAPIAALYFLAKGEDNRIEPMPAAEAARRLLRNILFFAEDAQLVKLVFRSACDFLQAVPACRLTFVPDARVWESIR